MDGVFYTSRIIAHIKFQGAVQVGNVTAPNQMPNIIFSYLMLLALIYDMLDIFLTGLSLKNLNNPYHIIDRNNITEAI
jgi:hypothetical protein